MTKPPDPKGPDLNKEPHNNNPFLNETDLNELTRDVAALNDTEDIADLNDEISRLHKIIEEYDDRLSSLVSSHEEDLSMMKLNYDNAIIEKEKTIKSQNTRISEYDEKLCLLMTAEENGKQIPCNKIYKISDSDKFHMKPARKSSKTSIQIKLCSNALCESSSKVNMIRCSCCLKFVCELCSKVQIQRLKPIMENCDNIYFVCGSCNDGIVPKKDSLLTLEDKCINTITNAAPEDITSKKSVENMFLKLETKLERLLDRKLDEKLEGMNKFSEKIVEEVKSNKEGVEDKLEEVISANKTFADTVANTSSANTANTSPVVNNFRSIINEQRNLELNETNDKKARAANIIIHGVAEPDTSDKDLSKKYNEDYITEFLQVVGVNVTSRSVYRLGKADPTKKRPIKFITGGEKQKDEIMRNLKKLKDVDKYRGISITEDYTINERDMIRTKTEEAKSKNANEPAESQFIWKVRGTPKNGLFIKKFRKTVSYVQTQETPAPPLIQL